MKINRENIIDYLVDTRWVWHIGLWVVYLTLSLPNYFMVNPIFPEQFFVCLFTDISVILMSYTITLILFPLFYYKKKYFQFFISIILNIIFYCVFNAFVIKYGVLFIRNIDITKEFSFLSLALDSSQLTVLLSLFFIMCKISKGVIIEQYLESKKRKLQMQSELDNLKAQLSPHFLFNTMNNFYGLSVVKSEKLPNLMLKLSDLMRYSLYGTKSDMVPLENEINYLKNYIELEKIRLEDTLQLSFDYKNEREIQCSIAPLILIVFIENAFKHSKTIIDKAIQINIKLNLSKDFWLHLEVENNFNQNQRSDINEVGGIGIENVKKRLEVIYPEEKHQLDFSSEGNIFKVNLKMKLKTIGS